MALTPLRWVALAIAGSLVVVTLILRPGEVRSSQVDRRQVLASRVFVLNAATSRAAERLRSLDLRDSVRVVLQRSGRPDTSRLIIAPPVEPALGAALRGLELRTRDYRPARPRVPVDIAFVLDTSRTIDGVGRPGRGTLSADFVLPGDSAGRCLVIVSVRPAFTDSARALRRYASWAFRRGDYASQLLGPCAFYERFGFPGPQVDAWLLSGAWQYGRRVHWDRAPATWMPRWQTYASFTNVTGWPLRDYISVDGFRCVSGDAAACTSILGNRRDPVNARELDILPVARLVSSASLSYYDDDWRRRRLGPMESSLLSDMVHDLGASRFEQFWTSRQNVTDAFRTAAGRDLGDWVTAWATQAYGKTGHGPAVPTSGIALALGVVAVSAAGAGVAARRRQVR